MSKIILIAFTVFAAFAQAFGAGDAPQVELNLANTILTSAAAIANDPQRSAQCFGAYMPKLNNLTAAYEQQYQDCVDEAEKFKDSVQNEVAAAAATVNATREEICSGLSDCVFDSRPYGYFECSDNAAGVAISKAYSIQTLSKDRMQYISLRYETIVYDQNVCTSKCSQTYVEESAKVHAELQDCLAGKTPDAPSTVGTTTVSSVDK